MLNTTIHKKEMIKLFLDILSNRNLSTTLGFKGGTALYLFYDLDRFSTDLDFNMIDEDFSTDEMTLEIEKSLKIEEYKNKRYTHFWLCSYSKGQHKIKVEVNKRKYPDRYDVKDFRGYSCKVLSQECIFAHKLCAITDRRVLQNRDLYDAWFMFSKNFEIEEEIIKLRTGESIGEYSKGIVKLIDKLPGNYNIRNGLGSVLDQGKRDWVKRSLLEELKKYLVALE